MTATDLDLATQLAKIHRQALGDQVYVSWEDLNEEAIASSVTAIIAVLAELHHQNLLVPDGGRPLTAEQWAHYQRMAADPRFAELSSDAIGVVKWPANPPLAPAEKPRTHTPSHHNPVTGTTRITVQRACNRCGRDLGDATEKELDACVNGTPLPDVHDECGCDNSPVVPAPTETSEIRAAADALSSALVILDPLETGHWEHAWRTLNDLDDCAKREKSSATAEAGGWDTWDAVPENVTVVSSFLDHRYRKVDGEVFRVLKDGKRYKVADFTPTDMRSFAPFVAAEEG